MQTAGFLPHGFPTMLLVVPTVSTLAGGWLALRLRRHLTFLMAFGTGLLLGAACLDLLPEALALARNGGMGQARVLAWTALATILFAALGAGVRRLEKKYAHVFPANSLFHRSGALLLIFHSFRDGMAIGAAFSVSHAAGYAVACGISAHDLGDGMNTIILTTRGRPAGRIDYLFLAADAVAPLLGGLATVWWVWSTTASIAVLVIACGFFLAMALSDFLPELRRWHGNRALLLPAALGGVAVIAVANFLLGRATL